MFQVNPRSIFYAFACLLKSSIFSHSSSFSRCYFTEKIEALQRIQIPLTTYVQFLCTHLGYSCQLYRLGVCRLWPMAQIQPTAHFCTACLFFFLMNGGGGNPKKDIFATHEEYRKLKFWWAETKFYWIKSMPVHLCTNHSGFTATTEELR